MLIVDYEHALASSVGKIFLNLMLVFENSDAEKQVPKNFPAYIFLFKAAIETLEKGVKYVQS